MQYTFLGFSQERLLDLDLDDRDAALLRFFIDFKDAGGMYSEEYHGETYYWVKYDHIKQELPIIGQHFKKDAIYRRFKNMAQKGVLKHRTKKDGGTFSYYTVGDLYYSLITSSEPTQPEIPFGNPSGSKTVPSGSKTGTPTVLEPYPYGSRTVTKDQSIKDQSTKKIREREDDEKTSPLSPALALFFENFPAVKLNGTQRNDIQTSITNEEAWKYTIWWWKFKEYRAERTDNMLDYYKTKAVPKLLQAQEQEKTPPQESLFTPKKPDNGNGNGDGHTPKLWQNVLKGLEKRINGPSFNTWVRPTQFLEQYDQTVRLEVPDDVFVYWLKEHYQTVIIELLVEQLGFEPTIEFVVENTEQLSRENTTVTSRQYFKLD